MEIVLWICNPENLDRGREKVQIKTNLQSNLEGSFDFLFDLRDGFDGQVIKSDGQSLIGFIQAYINTNLACILDGCISNCVDQLTIDIQGELCSIGFDRDVICYALIKIDGRIWLSAPELNNTGVILGGPDLTGR